MNAKEKAIEIYNQFKKQIEYNCQPSTLHGMVKQCAIIHVKGIIDCLDRLDFSLEIDYEVNYWQQVLHELNLM